MAHMEPSSFFQMRLRGAGGKALPLGVPPRFQADQLGLWWEGLLRLGVRTPPKVHPHVMSIAFGWLWVSDSRGPIKGMPPPRLGAPSSDPFAAFLLE